MDVAARIVTLELAETFVISRSARDEERVVEVSLTCSGVRGYGEAAPIERYDESPASALAFLEGAGELRHKESDRVAGIVAGLVVMGARIEAVGDDIVIDGPTSLRGAVVDSLADHRLAMTFAIAGLVAGGATTVLGADSVAISYPTFFADLERIRS